MQKDAYTRIVGVGTLFCVSFLVFFIDLVSKELFFSSSEHWPGNHWLAITQHINSGATFNAPVPVWLLVFCSAGFLSWFLVTFFQFSWWWRHRGALVTAGLLVGGALGNLVDRIRLGYVRDWLLVAQTSILNVADLSIVLGCLGLFFTFAHLRPRQCS